jgi:hypothetical protein
MIKILEIEGNPNDSCSWYRGHEPLSHLSDNISITLGYLDVTWPYFSGHDILFIQRPYNVNGYNIVTIAKNYGLKVWVDYDDDQFSIPETSVLYDHFKSTGTQELMNIIKSADIITVATERLKEKFSKINPNVFIIPNCHNDYVYPLSGKTRNTNNKKCLWRGSVTHESDLLHFWKSIEAGIKENPDWQFDFIGHQFTFQKIHKYENYNPINELPILNYMQLGKRINPSLLIVPLEKMPLNVAKSNISWIEGTYFGAGCLMPNFGDFKDVPGLHYSSKGTFDELFRNVLNNEIDLKRLNEESWSFIKENRLLSKWNKKREEIVNYLM